MLLSLSLPARADQVTIFAAASLKTALDRVLEGSSDVSVSYAGSSVLARQIALGAPADIVIMANVAWMDYLQDANRLANGTRTDLLGNRLVLIAPSDMMFIAQADRAVEDIVAGGRVAMALVNAVPAGIYGKEALQNLGAWETVEPSVVQTDNVRAALRLVAMGEVPFGVVYATDAQAEEKVQIVHRFDPDSHTPVLYPIALVAGRDTPTSRAVRDRIMGAEAAEIFVQNGFQVFESAAQ